MKIFVVIPCFNEQDHLEATCKSLEMDTLRGFPVHLVLVDNASTDSTVGVMERIKSTLGITQVTIVHEPTRGYVPARHAGIVAVAELVKQEGIPSDQALVLQADADTIYLPGYINEMYAASIGKPGHLLEGSAITGREFAARFEEFDKLCRRVDYAVEPWIALDDAQVIVDDKVSGFLLSDYFCWGGHIREFDQQGLEVLAETTRLFMHGKRSSSAVHLQVKKAIAVPSRRKLLIQAPAYFASAGFPRHADWVKVWSPGPDTASEFLASPYNWPMIRNAIRFRLRHLLALFMLLPAMCDNKISIAIDIAEFASMFSVDNEHTAGGLICIALAAADERGGILDQFLDQNFPMLNFPTN